MTWERHCGKTAATEADSTIEEIFPSRSVYSAARQRTLNPREGFMVIILFRSRLSPDAGTEYGETVEEMMALATAMPGFVSFKSFSAPDGERISVIEFESEETLAAWRDHPDHRRAQQRGREKFYAEYHLQVCALQREARFRR